MPGIDRRLLQNLNWPLLVLVLILAAIGLANLISATHAGGEAILTAPVRRQLVSLALGLAALLVALLFDYRHLERFAPLLYGATLVLLAATLVFAPVTRGSRSWLVWGPLRLQPSELAKLGLVLMLARHFHHHPPDESLRLRELGRALLLVAAPVALIVLEHDLGVALLVTLIAGTYALFVRIPARAWVAMAAVAAALAVGLWLFALQPYQRERIQGFLDPGHDPLASGYQANQSRIAVGSGGLLGKGYLEGTQTQLRFLPTQHTDFVFSVLAEEWGFVGATATLGLYLGVLLLGVWTAAHSKESFGAWLSVGIVGILFWPAAINVAMVLGLAPVVGVPLPFFSYGGSALVVSLASVGLLLNVSMRRYVF